MDLMINDLNSFGLDLFRNVYDERLSTNDNTIVSTISAVIALLMALSGSQGDTRQEIIKSLKLNNLNLTHDANLSGFHDTVHEFINSLITIENPDNSSNRLVLANKMIVNNQFILDSYRHLIETKYDAKIDQITTPESFDQVVNETNKWISDLTNKKITKILDNSFKTTSLALIDAIYFNYEWVYEFDPKKTKKREFFTSPNKQNSLQVDMMELNRKNLLYFNSKKLNSHLLSLPYKRGKFLFNILFPIDENDYLLSNDRESLMNKLDFDLLKEEMAQQSIESISLLMPRFTAKKTVKLESVLKKLGIISAFDSRLANFSKIEPNSNLFIDEVLQYSYIDVNERGTEAAAVTIIKIVNKSLMITRSIKIVLNRPFIYFITDKSTGTILFIGSYNGNQE